MVAKAAAAKTPADEAPQFDFSHMPFAVVLDLPVPELPKKASREGGLPFRSMFDAFLPAAFAGQKPSFFVPVSFFKDRPNVNVEKVNAAYVRQKVRDQFKNWQTDKNLTEADAASRAKVSLVLINRDGIDEGSVQAAKAAGIDPQPGVSIWMVKTAEEG